MKFVMYNVIRSKKSLWNIGSDSAIEKYFENQDFEVMYYGRT